MASRSLPMMLWPRCCGWQAAWHYVSVTQTCCLCTCRCAAPHFYSVPWLLTTSRDAWHQAWKHAACSHYRCALGNRCQVLQQLRQRPRSCRRSLLRAWRRSSTCWARCWRPWRLLMRHPRQVSLSRLLVHPVPATSPLDDTAAQDSVLAGHDSIQTCS